MVPNTQRSHYSFLGASRAFQTKLSCFSQLLCFRRAARFLLKEGGLNANFWQRAEQTFVFHAYHIWG